MDRRDYGRLESLLRNTISRASFTPTTPTNKHILIQEQTGPGTVAVAIKYYGHRAMHLNVANDQRDEETPEIEREADRETGKESGIPCI